MSQGGDSIRVRSLEAHAIGFPGGALPDGRVAASRFLRRCQLRDLLSKAVKVARPSPALPPSGTSLSFGSVMTRGLAISIEFWLSLKKSKVFRMRSILPATPNFTSKAET